MTVSILVVDDEPDVALLFRRQFRREVGDGTYVMKAQRLDLPVMMATAYGSRSPYKVGGPGG